MFNDLVVRLYLSRGYLSPYPRSFVTFSRYFEPFYRSFFCLVPLLPPVFPFPSYFISGRYPPPSTSLCFGMPLSLFSFHSFSSSFLSPSPLPPLSRSFPFPPARPRIRWLHVCPLPFYPPLASLPPSPPRLHEKVTE